MSITIIYGVCAKNYHDVVNMRLIISKEFEIDINIW